MTIHASSTTARTPFTADPSATATSARLPETDAADQALKAKHRAMWASGDYPSLARDIVGPLGPILVAALGINAGERVLDVAAGTGSAALAAAREGAIVTASDLTPELLDVGKAEAGQAGRHVTWQSADAENLPFADASFDVVASCIGVMFAPHHDRAAAELVRVCRPGGRIGLLSWTPGGFIGQMFAAMKAFAPPPPPGAQPPPLWGDLEHVRDLLGASVTDLESVTGLLRVDHFSGPQDFRRYFATNYGPTIAVYRYLAGQDEGERRAAELDGALDELAVNAALDGAGTRVMEWEYRIVTAQRADQ